MRYLATILARGAEGMATLPEELAVTESIVTQDEDELQTSLRAGHLRFPHERSTSVLAQLEYGVTDRLQAILAVPYGVRDPSEAGAVHGLEDVDPLAPGGMISARATSPSSRPSRSAAGSAP